MVSAVLADLMVHRDLYVFTFRHIFLNEISVGHGFGNTVGECQLAGVIHHPPCSLKDRPSLFNHLLNVVARLGAGISHDHINAASQTSGCPTPSDYAAPDKGNGFYSLFSHSFILLGLLLRQFQPLFALEIWFSFFHERTHAFFCILGAQHFSVDRQITGAHCFKRVLDGFAFDCAQHFFYRLHRERR